MCLPDGFVGSNYHMCAGVETTHESSCQPFQALTVPVESQQNFCAACGGFLSAESIADVTGFWTIPKKSSVLLDEDGCHGFGGPVLPTISAFRHLLHHLTEPSVTSHAFSLFVIINTCLDYAEAKEAHCPSATNVLLTPAAVDGYGANSDATQAGLGSSQGHSATDSAPSDFLKDAPSSSECDALPACSAGVETTHESSCQPFQALTVPVESQQNFCAACGGFLSAEGTADVTVYAVLVTEHLFSPSQPPIPALNVTESSWPVWQDLSTACKLERSAVPLLTARKVSQRTRTSQPGF
ncbi:uncharacterized protein LOC142775527 [Rhipicephalus microplus]|uniref:uncharacterized protein LOC142775527 n=1 Tax=Rhipicephalus microplus TaxID=6941 RepID=UPI003F6BD272